MFRRFFASLDAALSRVVAEVDAFRDDVAASRRQWRDGFGLDAVPPPKPVEAITAPTDAPPPDANGIPEPTRRGRRTAGGGA